uniref:Transmembrane protein n=1 Tax=Romanomermis culicivorax TaxID=13658 RepID=A0A915L160_ROMCU
MDGKVEPEGFCLCTSLSNGKSSSQTVSMVDFVDLRLDNRWSSSKSLAIFLCFLVLMLLLFINVGQVQISLAAILSTNNTQLGDLFSRRRFLNASKQEKVEKGECEPEVDEDDEFLENFRSTEIGWLW